MNVVLPSTPRASSGHAEVSSLLRRDSLQPAHLVDRPTRGEHYSKMLKLPSPSFPSSLPACTGPASTALSEPSSCQILRRSICWIVVALFAVGVETSIVANSILSFSFRSLVSFGNSFMTTSWLSQSQNFALVGVLGCLCGELAVVVVHCFQHCFCTG